MFVLFHVYSTPCKFCSDVVLMLFYVCTCPLEFGSSLCYFNIISTTHNSIYFDTYNLLCNCPSLNSIRIKIVHKVAITTMGKLLFCHSFALKESSFL